MKASDVFYSAFERREDDNYPTIDERCLDGLLHYHPEIGGVLVDPCSRGGSALVDQLRARGMSAIGLDDAFAECEGDWLITNPPFKRAMVDRVVRHQIERVSSGKFHGLAVLVRSNWCYAKSREDIFNSRLYAGDVRLAFRVWWTEARDQEPKHNYVWHIWRKNGYQVRNIRTYVAPYDGRYVVKHGD